MKICEEKPKNSLTVLTVPNGIPFKFSLHSKQYPSTYMKIREKCTDDAYMLDIQMNSFYLVPGASYPVTVYPNACIKLGDPE